MTQSVRGLIRFAVILSVTVFAPAVRAEIVDLYVTSTADSGPGSLRWAIENATGTYNRITIQIESGIIQLESPLPPITRPASVSGRLERGLVIDGSLVEGDGLRVERAGSIRNIHTRNFKSGAGIVLGGAGVHLESTGNRYGIRLTAPESELDLVTLSGNETGLLVEAGATGVVIGELPLPILVPWGYGPLMISGNGVGIDWRGEGVLLGNEISGNGTGVIVAGTARLSGNHIHQNSGNGVTVLGTASALFTNRFEQNGGLGIDLGGDGVDPIDALDADAGPHSRLNRPVIESVELFCASLSQDCARVVRGRLDAEPETEYTIRFFEIGACHPSGYGEGGKSMRYSPKPWPIVRTDSTGHAEFLYSWATSPSADSVVSALTIDGGERTSEFSACATSSGVLHPSAANDLSISVTGPSEAALGDRIQYHIHVTNTGVSPVLFQITSTREHDYYSPMSIAPGESIVISRWFTATLPAGETSGTMTIGWTLAPSPHWGTDPQAANDTASISTLMYDPVGVPLASPLVLVLTAVGLLLGGLLAIRT